MRAVMPTDPASYRVVYSGLKGLLLDEYVRAVSRKWADDLEFYYTQGALSEVLSAASQQQLNDYRQDYYENSYADNRKSWWHYLDDWGPIDTYYTGSAVDIINVGPFRVSSKFRFKVKDYKAKISSKWSYKFTPILRLTSKLPLIRELATGHQFTYKRNGVKLVRVVVAFGVNLVTIEALAEAQVELLNW